jgi:tetratricopeptide (TPR) repeat protein
MRFAFTILARTFPPAFVVFLFIDLIVNPNIPRLGTVADGTSADGLLSVEQSRDLLASAHKLIAAGKDEQGLAPMLKLSASYPENYVYNKTIAEIYHRQGKYQEEADYWERFLKNAPLPGEGCPQVGHAYWNQQKYNEAIDALERCLAFDPEVGDSIFFLAHALELRGQTQRAEALFSRGVAHDPHSMDNRIGLARVDVRLDRLPQARKLIDQVLRESPENVDALLVAGLVYWRMGDAATAKRHLVKGASLSEGYADYYHVLGRIEESQGHVKEALMRYDRALELDPGNEDAARRRAALRRRQQ